MGKRNIKTLVVIREGNGKPSRSVCDVMKACTPAAVQRLRDAALKGMADEEWGWEVGRLFLTGKITADEFEAGKRLRRLVFAWRVAYGVPRGTIKPVSLFLMAKSPEVDPDSEKGRAQADRAVQMNTELNMAYATVGCFGGDVLVATRRTVEDDCAPIGESGYQQVKRGLGALSSMWGLTAKGK